MINISPPPIDPNAQAAANLWQQVCNRYTRLQSLLNVGANFVWANPSGLTPQQAVAYLGTNAAAVFQLSGLLCGLIGTISGTTPSPMPPGWAFTANADGTVTLTPPATN